MKNRASIDIGSNSCLLLIMNEKREILFEESHITGLGRGIDKTKNFSNEAMDETYRVLQNYSVKCLEYGLNLTNVVMTATEASRVASNANDFYKKVENEIGLRVRIISGDQEAYYTALGISEMSTLKDQQFVIMDIGGASTEFILINRKPFEILSSTSLPVGSARATDWIANGEFQSRIDEIYEKSDLQAYSSLPLVCVAGTMTTLALVLQSELTYSADQVNSFELTKEQFFEHVQSFKKKDVKELAKQYEYIGKRVSTLEAGVDIATFFVEKLNVSHMKFSTYGLRYGTILDSINLE